MKRLRDTNNNDQSIPLPLPFIHRSWPQGTRLSWWVAHRFQRRRRESIKETVAMDTALPWIWRAHLLAATLRACRVIGGVYASAAARRNAKHWLVMTTAPCVQLYISYSRPGRLQQVWELSTPTSCLQVLPLVSTRDVHGNGIPNGNGNPMGISWEWE